MALSGNQRATDCQTEGELFVEVLRGVRQRPDELQSSVQMDDGFQVGGASGGQLAGAAPVRDRPSRQARLGQMLRQHFRLSLTDVRELLFQRLGDAGVQLLATALEHGLVGSVLDQRMLEGVGRLGRRATAEDQLRADQLLKGITQLVRDIGATAASRSWENSRPITAPVWATSLTGARRSRRAISESCSVVGIASGGRAPDSS